MKKINFKNIYPYLIAIGIFIVLGYTYFPQMFEGKELNQHDITSWRASAQEIFKFRETTGGEPLWTGSMFSGMPSNMISIHYPGNYTTHINQLFYIFKNPAAWYIVSMIGFYLLLLCFKVDRWVAIVGAIAFTFCAYNLTKWRPYPTCPGFWRVSSMPIAINPFPERYFWGSPCHSKFSPGIPRSRSI